MACDHTMLLTQYNIAKVLSALCSSDEFHVRAYAAPPSLPIFEEEQAANLAAA